MFAPDIALGVPVNGMPGADLGLGSAAVVPMSSMDQALMQMGHPDGPGAQLYTFEQPGAMPSSGAMLSTQMSSQVGLTERLQSFRITGIVKCTQCFSLTAACDTTLCAPQTEPLLVTCGAFRAGAM